MLLNRNSDYAIRALLYIADKNRVVTAKELSEKLKIPMPFLRRILQKLSRAKIITSEKGKSGGFIFLKESSKINLLDVIGVFQEKRLVRCLFKKKLCPNVSSCLLRKKMLSMEQYIIGKFKNTTLKSLSSKGG